MVRATFVQAPAGAADVFPQVGYAIGKRCGNAVTRNTLRRRLREAARVAAPNVPRGAYLLRAEPAATTTPVAQLSADVAQAMQRAGSVASAGTS
jgi:ribonuclease P protein component